MKSILIIVVLVFAVSVHAQVLTGKYTKAEVQNFKIIEKATTYLRTNHPKGTSRDTLDFLTDFCRKFYDTSYFQKSLAQSSLTLEERFNMQMLLLHNIYLYLQILTKDSIYNSSFNEIDWLKNEKDQNPFSKNALCTYYIIDGRKFVVNFILFNDSGKKIAFINPFIDFEDKNKEIDIEGFF
ncbi:MAG: hypothetical protein C4329_09325 [Chitinophagaceae bacterium]